MKKSALQKARAAYQPKLPIVLTGPVKAVEGHPTQSVADQEDKKTSSPTLTVFPNSNLRRPHPRLPPSPST